MSSYDILLDILICFFSLGSFVLSVADLLKMLGIM